MKIVSSLLKKTINQSILPHLEIFLSHGTNLPSTDLNGLSDPYLVFSIRDQESVKSSVCEKSLNPQWRDTLLIAVPSSVPQQDVMQCELVGRLFDRDTLSKDDLVGEFKILFRDLLPQVSV